MSDLIWLSAAQMRRIEPYFPLSHGVPRVDDRALLQIFRLVGEVLFSPRSHVLTFEILREQRHRLCECTRSNAESSFNNPGFSTNVAGEIKNGSLSFA